MKELFLSTEYFIDEGSAFLLTHSLVDARLKRRAKRGDELNAFGSDAHHHFAAIVSVVTAFDESEIFQTIHEASGSGGGMPHLASNVRHGLL